MRRTWAVVAVVVGVFGAACDPVDEGAGPVDLGDVRLIGLTTEDTCGDLLEWFKTQAKATPDAYLGHGDVVALEDGATAARAAAGGAAEEAATATTAAPVAGTDYSTTNVQEEGVDEPDVVKTDGRRLVTLAGSHLRVVDVSGATPRLEASVPMPFGSQLLLDGDRVMVIGGPEVHAMPMPADGRAAGSIAPVPGQYRPRTRVTVVDIARPSQPTIVETVELDGGYVAARLHDGVARLVLRWSPIGLMEQIGRAPETRDAVIDASTIGDWKPDHVPCEAVHHPEGFRGVGTITVVTVDPDDPTPGNGASVVGAGDTVYASRDRLYVSASNWGATQQTTIHAFDISDEITTRYVASGAVDGTLLNQFSMSEHDGELRVATTKSAPRDGSSESQVAVLREDGAALRQIGLLGGLGKTERIYAVRFLGEVAYVVTFRETDPLYVVDLANPERPEMKGELKIPGYSAYLHPIGDGRLLGIGQDATAEGRRLGSQISLFDVSDPSHPKQVAKHDLRSSSSTAEHDHHAFLWWPATNLAVVPVNDAAGGPLEHHMWRPGVAGVAVEGDRLVERGRVQHPTLTPILRSLVMRDVILTISESGILTSDIDSLGREAWMAF